MFGAQGVVLSMAKADVKGGSKDPQLTILIAMGKFYRYKKKTKKLLNTHTKKLETITLTTFSTKKNSTMLI